MGGEGVYQWVACSTWWRVRMAAGAGAGAWGGFARHDRQQRRVEPADKHGDKLAIGLVSAVQVLDYQRARPAALPDQVVVEQVSDTVREPRRAQSRINTRSLGGRYGLRQDLPDKGYRIAQFRN